MCRMFWIQKDFFLERMPFFHHNNWVIDKSTTESFNRFIDFKMGCFERGNQYWASCVDLSRSFDCVSLDKLKFKLKKYGSDDQFGRFFS